MPVSTKAEVLEQIKSVALSEGIAPEKIQAFAEKCYDSIPAWQPYGGATSFAQIDQQKAVREYSYSVDDQTSALRGIIENVTGSSDFSVDEKATAIKSAADEFKTRVSSLTVPTATEVMNNKNLLTKLKNFLFSEEEIPEEKKVLTPPEVGGFKVYQDPDGKYRWLALSSNAFEDRAKELFTTKALEEAVDDADKTGQRGPLLVFHVPSAVIGQTDYQAVVGRFLVESGTFEDTPLGQKAVEYFLNSDEEFQMSIGYKYIDGDEKDGQYDWVRFKERSVLPSGTAANPWTEFKVIGENLMNPVKAETLEKIFGKELAAGVIATAEEKTKGMEESGVRFKDFEEQTEFGEITDEVIEDEVKPEPMVHEHGNVKHTHLIEAGKSHVHGEKSVAFKAMPTALAAAVAKKKPGADDEEADDSKKSAGKKEETPEAITKIAELIGDLSVTVASLTEDVKELKKSDDEKVKDLVSPRTTFPSGVRPTESNDNVLSDGDKEKLEALFGTKSNENPAALYASDLFPNRA